MLRTLPNWVGEYIGIPFVELGRDREGCDCWGLYRLVMEDQFGLRLPHMGEFYLTTADGDALEHLLHKRGTETDAWLAIQPGNEELGDLVLMSGLYKLNGRWQKADMHVGLVVDSGQLLHVEQGIDSSLGNYMNDRRLSGRVRGFYRPLTLH